MTILFLVDHMWQQHVVSCEKLSLLILQNQPRSKL